MTAERSDEHLLLDARKAQWINTIWSVYVEQSDRIKKGRYDSWQHVALARPSPTWSEIFYRIWRPFTHETKVPRIATAEEKVLPRRSCRWWPYCESVTVVQKAMPLLCFALLCFALPCPALIGHCWSSCAATSHSRRRKNSTLVERSEGAGHANLTEAKVRSEGLPEGKCIILPPWRSLMMLVAARNKPLIIINHKRRIHEVVSIIVTCYTDKEFLAWLMAIGVETRRIAKAPGF